jgi:hypothetical protein
MHAGRLMLMVLVTGPIAGSLAAIAVDPTMTPPPEAPWHKLVESTYVPKPIYQIVEAGPEDLSPLYSTVRSRILERRYLDAATRRRDVSYGDIAEAPDPPRGTAVYDGGAAEAAAPAAAAANDAALTAAPPEGQSAVIIVDPGTGAGPDLPAPEEAPA